MPVVLELAKMSSTVSPGSVRKRMKNSGNLAGSFGIRYEAVTRRGRLTPEAEVGEAVDYVPRCSFKIASAH